MLLKLWHWILGLFLLLSSARATADFIPPVPTDYTKVKVSLLTVGRGVQLHARMGHSILRVQDFSNQMDYLVNWGMFNFQDPLFIPKFFRGVLMYRMAFSPYQQTVDYYRNHEQRSVYEDELSLTPKQKQILINKIIWNAQPQNVHYPYQYFRNNCATIPRDYLDLALSGGISKQLGNLLQPETYRDYVWQNISSNILVGWALDVIFNSDTDIQLTRFEQMFYPINLRKYLNILSQVDDTGRPLLGSPLVVNSRLLVDLPEPGDSFLNGYRLSSFIMGLPLLLIYVVAWISRRGDSKLLAWQNRFYGFVSLWWGMTAGFFGCAHFFMWLFSSHTDLHHNSNIVLFWPIEFLVIVPGVYLGLSGKSFHSIRFLKIGFWRTFAQIHIISIFVYVIFAYSPLNTQDVQRVITYMVPLSLLYYLGMLLMVRGHFNTNN